MSRTPLHRRFGQGVAGLPIGRPAGTVSLSRSARTPSRAERRVAVLPILVCAGLAFLVFESARYRAPDETAPQLAEGSKALQMEYWRPALPDPAVPDPVIAESPASHFKSDSQPEVAVAVPIESSQQAPSFAISNLQMASLSTRAPLPTESAPNDSPSRVSDHRPGPAHPDSARRAVERAGSRALASAGPLDLQTLPSPSDLQGGPPRGSGARDSDTRPVASDFDVSSAQLAARTQVFRGIEPHQDLLEADTSGTPPPVSARGAIRNQSTRSARQQEIVTNITHAGWREVPLDELPDCMPPERQDLLKKHILVAAPFQRECSHENGSYRFVEIRNLNAFLMWSRPDPNGTDQAPAPRDVCDVLEQALRCLKETHLEESTSK